MLVRHSFDNRFVDKVRDIDNKYGTEMRDLDGIGIDKLDINNFAKSFFRETSALEDLSSDANANVDDRSVLFFENEYAKSIHRLNAYYLLWKKMVDDEKYGIKRANKILEMCINGALKIHDLHFFRKPYCYAFSLEPVVSKGLPFIKKIRIGPAQHLTSFVNHVIQFTAYCSNQMAGAVAFPDFLIYFDYFARKDLGEEYWKDPRLRKLVEQEFQSAVYSWNWPYRGGSQSSFVNVNIYDKYFLEDLFSNVVYPDMSVPNFESIIEVQKIYLKFISNESTIQPFTFPVTTATMYKDDEGIIQDQDFLDFISEINQISGIVNIFTGPLGVLSSCCRLRNDTNEIKEYTNSFGAAGVSIGSHRVVTLNLPRIAYESQDTQEYMRILEYNAKAAQDVLDVHREILIDTINRKRLPLYTHQFMFLEKQFSTIGFIGINEACEMMGYHILEEDGVIFAKGILDKLNSLNEQRTKEDGNIRNIEQIPGETAAVTFAKKDKMLFDNQNFDIYSNQYIPLWINTDIEQRIKAQGTFDSMCGGGAICHINVSDSLTKNQMKQIILHAAKEGCIYFAINMAQCRCNSCGKLFIGKFETSPCHNASVTKYLRVVGFLTAVDNWIPERRVEYTKRQFYDVKKI